MTLIPTHQTTAPENRGGIRNERKIIRNGRRIRNGRMFRNGRRIRNARRIRNGWGIKNWRSLTQHNGK